MRDKKFVPSWVGIIRSRVSRGSVRLLLVCWLAQSSVLHAQFGALQQILPQVALGGIARTLVSVHNPGNTPTSVKIEIYRTGSGGLFTQQDVALAARETRTLTFGEGQEELIVGFARLTSDEPITSSALFQFIDNGTLLGEAGVLPQARVEQFQMFAFVNTSAGTNTGVALANDGEAAVDVTARQLQNGQVVATAEFALGAKEHRAAFLNQDPFFPGLDNYADTVEFTATGPVAPLALRQDGLLTTTISVATPQTLTINPGAVGTNELADGAVTSEKISEGAVGSRELADEIEVQTLGIRNTMGTEVAALGASDSNGAFFNLNNGAGNRMVGIFSTDDGRSNGSLGIFDSSGMELLGLHSTDAGSGFLTTRSRTGSRLVEISDATSLDSDLLGDDQWGAITTFDSSGQQLVRLSRWSVDDEKFGFIAARNNAGMDMVRLRGTAGNSGGAFGKLESFDAAGHRLVNLGRTRGQFGFVATNNPDGIDLVRLTATSSGNGAVETRNADGQEMVRISTGGSGAYGRISTRAAVEGTELVVVSRTSSGAGLVNTRNAAGNQILRLGSSTSGGMTSGYVSVRNATGTETAGINGRTGTVFGNTKSFIVPDPSQPDRKIRYTSLEGPEAAIYVRGRAELLQGQALVEFPDHFAALSIESSITVNLTPRSANSLGLAVVEVLPESFEVRELLGGQGSYLFDYVAHGVRKGYEDYPVYIEEGRSPSGVETNADGEDSVDR